METNDEWILSQTLFGVTTYYRREKDGSLSIKLEGVLEGVPLFEQVAVVKEVDLHCKWAPFCTSSLTIKDLDKLDTVAWFMIGLPGFGLARDGVFRAIGCDALQDEGCILIAGQGYADRKDAENMDTYAEPFLASGLDQLEIPSVPNRFGTGRMTIRNFSANFNVSSPTSIKMKLIANVEPRITFIPQALMDFIMRKMCGVVVSKLQTAAKRAVSDPVHNAHAKRIRQESRFYRGWLLPKFEAYCDMMDWDLPSVAALEVDDDQDEMQHSGPLSSHRSRGIPPGRVPQNPDSQRTYGSHNDDDVHTVGDASEAVSGITMSTGLTGHHSADQGSSHSSRRGVSSFLKKMQRKAAEKKRAEIEKSRQRFGKEVLTPRPFSVDDAERIRELRELRSPQRDSPELSTRGLLEELPEESPAQSHVGTRGFWGSPTSEGTTRTPRSTTGGTSSDSGSNNTGNTTGESLYWFSFLHQHSKVQRMVNLTTLAAATMLMLFPEMLIGTKTHLTDEAETWWWTVLLDVATLLYLATCGVVHFVFCDVALVYTFDALELGMKTGYQSKRFYSEMTRMGVVALSAGAVSVSILRACLQVWLRMVTWASIVSSGFVSDAAHKIVTAVLESSMVHSVVSVLPSALTTPVISTVSSATSTTAFIVRQTLALVRFVVWTIDVGVFQSNRVGGLVVALRNLAVSSVVGSRDFFVRYVQHVSDVFQNLEQVPAWRNEAIETARLLLSYSAFFLLVMTVLFDAMSRYNKRTQSEQELQFSQSSIPDLQEEETLATTDGRSGEAIHSSGRGAASRDGSSGAGASVTSTTGGSQTSRGRRFRRRRR